MNKERIKQFSQRILPAPVYRWLKDRWHVYQCRPPLGMTRWGDLRRLEPIDSRWGFSRGQPIDRYYIEKFLARHAGDIRGRVLEMADRRYTERYGGDRVTRSDVLHVEEGNPEATIVADLTDAPQIPDESFDCFILTQTLQFIYETRPALKTAHRILKPGGILLVTISGISPMSDPEWSRGWFWNFTTLSARRLFEEVFPDGSFEVESFGNILSAIAFLQGLASRELRGEELEYRHPGFPVTIAVRAVKSNAG
ncbi:class I SAM-dependent methyltransferase [Pannus brasiliensis CCIBt3594]|uniref:Class I SAM-dependent methyltransferase n=1 Tax=Pannus brasiliensis CCIBt3594 TaxID=1427578 RepID=A0AAW9R012_9CHRO